MDIPELPKKSLKETFPLSAEIKSALKDEGLIDENGRSLYCNSDVDVNIGDLITHSHQLPTGSIRLQFSIRNSDLCCLTEFTKLELAFTQYITDISPLAEFTALVSLEMNTCVGLEDVSSLEYSNIIDLSMYRCIELTDIAALGKMRYLTTLTLDYSHKIEDISSLGKSTTLTNLSLVGTSVRDVTSLAESTSITVLNLSSCYRLTDVKPLGEMKKLTTLTARNCNALSHIVGLGRSTSIVRLDLSYCTLVMNVSALGVIPTLDVLSLGSCINITCVDALKRVKTLNLRGCVRIADYTSVPHAITDRH
jgi:Leucine-rich repeat (LRR) protein